MPTVGIANIGNTCGINTWLQHLFAIPQLRDYVRSFRFTQDGLGYRLQEVFNTWSKSESSDVIVPRSLYKTVYQLSNGLFVPNEPLDIAELWIWSMNVLHEECASEWVIGSGSGTVRAKIERETHKHQNGKQSGILDIVQGVQLGFVKCRACDFTPYNVEPYITIPLELQPTDAPTVLSDLFCKYFQTEQLEGWKCDKCGEKDAFRLLRFWTLPKLVIVVLKRFQNVNNTIQKMHNPVDISENLTFHKGSVMSDEHDRKYRLLGIGLHHGSYFGGHYTALSQYDGVWYHCDDHQVQRIDDMSVVCKNNRNAYVIIYEADDLALRSSTSA